MYSTVKTVSHTPPPTLWSDNSFNLWNEQPCQSFTETPDVKSNNMNNDTDKEDLLGALFPRMGWRGGGGAGLNALYNNKHKDKNKTEIR